MVEEKSFERGGVQARTPASFKGFAIVQTQIRRPVEARGRVIRAIVRTHQTPSRLT